MYVCAMSLIFISSNYWIKINILVQLTHFLNCNIIIFSWFSFKPYGRYIMYTDCVYTVHFCYSFYFFILFALYHLFLYNFWWLRPRFGHIFHRNFLNSVCIHTHARWNVTIVAHTQTLDNILLVFFPSFYTHYIIFYYYTTK